MGPTMFCCLSRKAETILLSQTIEPEKGDQNKENRLNEIDCVLKIRREFLDLVTPASYKLCHIAQGCAQ